MLLLLTIVSVIATVLVALVVILKNHKSLVHRWVFIFLLCLSSWALSTNLLEDFWTGDGVWLLKLPFLFALLVGFAAKRFAAALSGTSLRGGMQLVDFSLLVLGSALIFSPYVVSNGFLVITADTTHIVLGRGVGYPFILAAIVYFFVVSIRILLQGWKGSRGQKRAQLGVVLSGLGLVLLVGFFTNAILPNITNTVTPARFAFVSLSIWTVVLSYAILRHRFMDIKAVVARSLGYVFSLLIIAVAYALLAFVFVVRFLAISQPSFIQQTSYILIAMLLALTFSPLKRFFDRVTRAIFYQDAYDTQDVLDAISSILVSEVSVNKLGRESLTILGRAVKPTYAAVVVVDTQQYITQRIISPTKKLPKLDNVLTELVHATQPLIVFDELDDQSSHLHTAMQKANVAVIARLETSHELIGYLIFGYKASGNIYSRQDVNVIRIVADELAVAVQNSMRFEEIARFNQTLQQEVDEATKQLRASNRQLHELDQAKDEFISMASHQLRTPLTSVKGYLSMALEGDAGELSENQRRLLQEAYASAQRMVYLIGDFLNVSRLKTGKFLVEPSRVQLNALVREEIDQLKATAAARELKIIAHVPSDFPAQQLDENKIRQVVMNFIDNAIFYSKTGGTITVELHKTARDVVFTVQDQGIGVPSSERHRVFSKFFRGSNARKARPDGTGIGLFMAKKVTVAHGGSIIIQTEENKGSTFGFRLPLKDDTASLNK